MKYVAKGQAPASFENWRGLRNENWSPSYLILANPEKSELHSALLQEQGFVCCYCGRRMDSGNSHIEHFRPQKLRPDLALEWSNLHASCVRDTPRGAPLHCGHAKDSAFDEQRQISPMSEGIEQRFLYTLYGTEEPTDKTDDRAKYMIEILNLNVDFLVSRRAEALNGVFDNEFLASVSEIELRRICASYRARDDLDRLPDFGHVIARYAEQLL